MRRPQTFALYMIFVFALALGACAPRGSSEPTASQPFRDCNACPLMVTIPAGSYAMGRDDGVIEQRYEGPVRQVTIPRPFAVGVTEVTTAEYRAFVDDTGHVSAVDCDVRDGAGWTTIAGASWDDPGFDRPPRDDEPVVCIDWNDAKAYVAWLSQVSDAPYRLITEAEWEYAARAGVPQNSHFWGPDDTGACDHANTYDRAGAASPTVRPYDPVACDDGFGQVAPVGSYAPNAFGLYDMTGNVWEWLEDCYAMPYPDGPIDGSAQKELGCDRRSVRGGAWSTNIDWQHPTFRGNLPPERISHIFGLRVARDL